MVDVLKAIPESCRIRLHGLSSRALGDLNHPLRPFMAESGEPAGINVAFGAFAPDLAGASNVDHHFFIKRDMVFFEDSVAGLSFAAEIRGPESDRTEIRIHARKRPFGPARWLFPEAALQSLIILPLLERKLAREGKFLLHAGGVTRGEETVLLVGRGGSYKTTYCFRLAREGWGFLGDDLLLFDRDRVHPLPLHAAYFDFYLRKGLQCEDEMGFGKKVAMLFHLRAPPAPSFVLGGPAKPTRLIVLDPLSGASDAACSQLSPGEAAIRARLNTRMERYADVPSKYVIGAYLDAYNLIFPDTALPDPHGSEWIEAFSRMVSRAECHLLRAGKRWREGNLEALRGLVSVPARA